MFELLDISKCYDNVKILDNVCLKIEGLDWIILSGESGSGKTTLLKIMTGLINADFGKLIYNGEILNERKLVKFRQNLFSVVFQEKNLIPEYTVYQNLIYTAAYNHIDSKRIDQLLNKFNLIDLKPKKITQLSAGQIQKIAIINSLLKDSEILFLDEPTGNLDKQSTQEIIELLQEVNKKMKIVMITHNQKLFDYANKVYELNNGKLINKKNVVKKDNAIKKTLPFYATKYSHKILFKMGVWNFLYYKKTYLLGIVIFSIACMGFVFSNFIGKNINDDLKNYMLARDAEYEMNIYTDEVITIQDVKKLSQDTNAKDYDFKLRLFPSDTKCSILINKGADRLNIEDLKFKSTYEINQPEKDVYISSNLYNLLQKQVSDIKDIEIQTKVLSGFDTYSTIYWVQDDMSLYVPLYSNESILITDYQIIDSDENVIYLANSIIENIANKHNQNMDNQSNQQIKSFRLKYSNYSDLLTATNFFEKNTNYTIFSIYDDFHHIQQNIENQFLIFSYSSYILMIIVVIVLYFLIRILEYNKQQQNIILYEQGMTKKDQIIILIYEIGLFFISSLIITIIGIYALSLLINSQYDIFNFLPYSLIEFASTYELPIENLKLLNLNFFDVLKELLLINSPVIVLTIISSIYNRYKVSAK